MLNTSTATTTDDSKIIVSCCKKKVIPDFFIINFGSEGYIIIIWPIAMGMDVVPPHSYVENF
jgi:hypothetical protein